MAVNDTLANGEISTSAQQVHNTSFLSDDEEPLPKLGRVHNSSSNAQSPWARKVILSLDGGGIRGFASLHILKAIMKEVEKEEHKQDSSVTCSAAYPWSNRDHDIVEERRTKFVPHHYIDYFVGTSTGGLSAMMLGRLQMTISEALSRYDHVGNKVFGRGRKTTIHGLRIPLYKSRYMSRALQHSTQQDVLQRLCHGSPERQEGFSNTNEAIQDRADKVILRNENQDAARTLVVSFGGEVNQETYVFRSYDHPKSPDPQTVVHNPGPASDWPLWKVGRATSAAPPYFSEFKEGKSEFLDGAFGFHNNPSDLAYTEVSEMHWAHEPLIVISIGTGIADPETGQSLKGCLKHLRGLIGHGRVFVKRVLDSQPQHERFERRIQEINAANRNNNKNNNNGGGGSNNNQGSGGAANADVKYFRFNIPRRFNLPEKIRLDDWRGANGKLTKSEISADVYEYISEESEGIAACARALVSLRRERARTERWEPFALHLVYTCREPGCKSPSFPSRFRLREHAVQVHGFVWQVPVVRSVGGGGDGGGGGGDELLSEWACYRDMCGRNRVQCFESREEFEEHSARVHRIPNPKIMPVEQFNAWLDGCRARQEVALPRQRTVVERHPENV